MDEGETPPEADAALARGAFYGSLAKAFGPVGDPLTSGEVFQELRKVGSEWPALSSTLRRLPALLSAEEGRRIAAERVRLFERGECPPYESSHRGGEDPLKDVVMADVAGFYRAFGLQPEGELPDHLVSELEFMALLCFKEFHALLMEAEEPLDIVRSAQETFLREHLSPWVESFREAVHRQAEVEAYPLLADLLVEFLQAEVDRLPPVAQVRATGG